MIDRRQALVGIAALTGAMTARPVRSQTLDTVNMGKLIGISDCPFYIADKKGYFRDAGVNVVWTTFSQSQAMVVPVAQGQLDGMGASVSAGIYNAAFGTIAADTTITIQAGGVTVPASVTINSVRALFEGGPVYHDLWQAILWCIGIFVVFLTISLNLYRRATA